MEARLKSDTARLVEVEGNDVKMMYRQATITERCESKGQMLGVTAGNDLAKFSTTPLHLSLFSLRFLCFMFCSLITRIQSFCFSHSSFLFPLCHFPRVSFFLPFCGSHILHGSPSLLKQSGVPANTRKQPDSG